MATRYNTNNSVPSNAVRDYSDNAQIIDELVHKQETTTKDRFGNDLKTWFGIAKEATDATNTFIENSQNAIEKFNTDGDTAIAEFENDATQAIIAAGYIPVDSFQLGADITLRNQILHWSLPDGDGEYYRWDGELPRAVPAVSTPETTGGVGPGAWVSVGDASLRSDLANVEKGDALIAVKQPYTGASQRTQHDKNKDVINVKDFGAVGDGGDHPLSEFFSTLSVAQIAYPFVTSLTQSIDYAALQSAINAAKALSAAVFIPSGSYVVNDEVKADYSVSIYGEGGQGLRDVDSTHMPSPVRGTVIYSKVSGGRTLSISPDKYCFGLTLRDFAIWGVEGSCDTGLYLNYVGWMGVVEGINIQHFPNQGLELGYVQDLYFNNCSVLQCGNATNYAITCSTDSNYVYFNGCHFELTAYMFNIDTCWNFSWNQCHFEVARPIGDNVTDDDRFYYISTAINLGYSYRLSFVSCTFIPVDSAYLATKLSLKRQDVPYFMLSSGDYISFSNCIWLAPEGSVDVGYFTGYHINFNGCKFIGMTPSKSSLYIRKGAVADCTFAIKVDDDSSRMFGATVSEGAVAGTSFLFLGVDSGVKRSVGFLLTGSATCNGNEYQESVSVHKYLDNAATVYGFDGKIPKFANINTSGDIDLTDYHPSTQLRVGANDVTIGHIYGSPYGRDVIVTTNNTGTIISYSAHNVLTAGAVNYSLGQYHTALFKCLSAGVSVLQQIG